MQRIHIIRDQIIEASKLNDLVGFEFLQNKLACSEYELETALKRVNPKKKPDKKFRYVEIADVNPATGEIESWSEILGIEAPGRARMLLKSGNIVLSSLKGSIKSIAIVPEELEGSVGTTGFLFFNLMKR